MHCCVISTSICPISDKTKKSSNMGHIHIFHYVVDKHCHPISNLHTFTEADLVSGQLKKLREFILAKFWLVVDY